MKLAIAGSGSVQQKLQHKLPMYVSCQDWETDALNISWKGLDSHLFCPSGLGSAGDAKDDHLQVQNHHDCTRVARDVLGLGSGESVSTKFILRLPL